MIYLVNFSGVSVIWSPKLRADSCFFHNAVHSQSNKEQRTMRILHHSSNGLHIGLVGLAVMALTVLPGVAKARADNAPPVAKAQVQEAYGKLPLSFEANRGQTDSRVKFLNRGRGYTLF